MKERPILFNAQMVRALLAGTKTQTRRLLKPQPHEDCCQMEVGPFNPTIIDRHGEEQPGDQRFGAWTLDGEFGWVCPYGQPGDRLLVREAWRASSAHDGLAPRDIPPGDAVEYAADPERVVTGRLRASMHMPRWASRITLDIVSVRVERLKDISEADALAEGVDPGAVESFARTAGVKRPAGFAYRDLWESINGAGSWDLNPLVWVVEFKCVKGGAA